MGDAVLQVPELHQQHDPWRGQILAIHENLSYSKSPGKHQPLFAHHPAVSAIVADRHAHATHIVERRLMVQSAVFGVPSLKEEGPKKWAFGEPMQTVVFCVEYWPSGVRRTCRSRRANDRCRILAVAGGH